jgi:MOSC domain-containing protein YiiM
MREVDSIEISTAAGCVGDFRGKPGARQVTVLASEAWQTSCQELGQQLPWTARRANLLVAGIALADSTGCQLAIGDVVLQITGETDPCRRMDQTAAGLRQALTPDWRGGVCCRVLTGGRITVGDLARLVSR